MITYEHIHLNSDGILLRRKDPPGVPDCTMIGLPFLHLNTLENIKHWKKKKHKYSHQVQNEILTICSCGNADEPV